VEIGLTKHLEERETTVVLPVVVANLSAGVQQGLAGVQQHGEQAEDDGQEVTENTGEQSEDGVNQVTEQEAEIAGLVYRGMRIEKVKSAYTTAWTTGSSVTRRDPVSNVTTWAKQPRMSCGLDQIPRLIKSSPTSTHKNNRNQLVDDGDISDTTPEEIEVGDSVQVNASTNGNVESVGDLSALCNDHVDIHNDCQIVCEVTSSSARCNVHKKGVSH